jgi:hypothetical protein
LARYLAIDWHERKLSVLAVSAGRGKSRAEKSLSVTLADDLTPATAAALGRTLKESLANAQIGPAPAVFVVSRDNAVLKDLKIPFVPAHEEPAVVRFQTAKELTEAAQDSVVDYTLLSTPTAGQQTPVQVAVVRKSLVSAITAFCTAAGLKLHGIVPRPYALAGLLDRAGPVNGGARGLLIPAGGDDVDFCVYQQSRLLWARSLHNDPGLTAEVRKNLLLFAAQSAETIDRIETAGLAGLSELPVLKQPLEVWKDTDEKPVDPVQFLGALGVADLAAKSGGLPINLASAKEPKPVVDKSKERMKAGLIAAAVLGALLYMGWWYQMSKMNNEINDLQLAKGDLEKLFKDREQERADLGGLKEWEETTISWLNEMYDLSARLPHVQGLRFTQVAAAQLRRRSPKDLYTGTVTIHGAMNPDQDALVVQFLEAMQRDSKYLKPQSPAFKGNEFVVKIDVAPRPPAQYAQSLTVPPQPKKETETLAMPEEAKDE